MSSPISGQPGQSPGTRSAEHTGDQGQLSHQQAARLLGDAIAQVSRVIVGQEHMVEQLMVSLLAKGHCLLEGVPGVAKTLAVRSFATVVGGDFARIQFTPDRSLPTSWVPGSTRPARKASTSSWARCS